VILYTRFPLLTKISVKSVVVIAAATTVVAIPFVISGIVVTLALTRSGGTIGRLYAADLAGAAAGCLVIIPLLSVSNITSVAFATAAIAAGGSCCFHRFARRIAWLPAALCAVLVAAAVVNSVIAGGFRVRYLKGRPFSRASIERSAWNSHSFVMIGRPSYGPAFYWGPGEGSDRFRTTTRWVVIDGDAGTSMTTWDGDRGSLDGVQYDVTGLAYHLRRGDVGIIGVGGGRDLLSAIWGQSTSILGIDVNGYLLNALKGPYRDVARIADAPGVTLVHDEARSYLSRGTPQFDVLQMSLTDTWAATGAGAFTLSENGLYTVEAWRVFLNAIKPTGLLSVSRWFAPQELSETTRLLALGVAAVLDRGAADPSEHLVLVSRGAVATLLVSNAPFSAADVGRITDVAARFGFAIHVLPGARPEASDEGLVRIARSASLTELRARVDHEKYDFTPPTDDRPYFFNLVKPSQFYALDPLPSGGVVWGNVRATAALGVLSLVAACLVAAIVIGPLVISGFPDANRNATLLALTYFALIGLGFVMVQIAFLQRFASYLGHPSYALAIILFSMISFAGVGSFLSDRVSLVRSRWLVFLPLAIGAALVAVALLLPPALTATMRLELPFRSLVALGFLAPVSVLLGFCFPLGMRLVDQRSAHATAWFWGVNGACGVMGSIVAVAVSTSMGIHTTFFIAAALYALLTIPAHVMRQRPLSARMQSPPAYVAAS
jgi:hypothetical protein